MFNIIEYGCNILTDMFYCIFIYFYKNNSSKTGLLRVRSNFIGEEVQGSLYSVHVLLVNCFVFFLTHLHLIMFGHLFQSLLKKSLPVNNSLSFCQKMVRADFSLPK